jgi:SARP family transcriptional regulator, regulator of embCAB operon
MPFALLGCLVVATGDRSPIALAPKPRQVLATLLVNADRVTYLDELFGELWPVACPPSSSTTLQTYIYQLRRALQGAASAASIVTRPAGYELRLDGETLDARVFEGLVERARAALPVDPAAARCLLGEALAHWQGPALADVERGPVLLGHAARLDELRMEAVEMSVEADLRCGRHREVIGDLRRLVALHPYHENLHAHLVRALSLAGRRHEAITAFRRARHALRTELGIDPSAALEEALRSALHGARPAAAASTAS